MDILKVQCKLITPMFMYGADGRTPELRPSELKGMMRFWWRAIRAEDNIDELRKREAEIFGGSGEKEGKSKVTIRIINQEINLSTFMPLPHSETKRFTLQGIKESSTFDISLTAEESLVSFFNNVFLLSAIIGGFGKRSRRGFGSVEIVKPKEFNFENLGKEDYLQKILNILNQINNHYKIQNSKIISLKKGGNYPWIKEIEIGENFSDWRKLLIKIGNASHKHNDPALGNASPRMASPIYVSLIKIKGEYYPIVTTLNSFFPNNYPRFNFQKQNGFKSEVLS